MPSNFRTYEAQSRLLAAVIAAHPALKLNFKAITLHFGSDVTESVIRHRIRPVKMQAEAIRQAVAKGQDAKDLSHIFHCNEKEINKYFGESTPQGIEFQFRAIKKDAKALRDAVEKGESPLTARKNVPAASRRTPASTPSKRKASPAVGLESGGGRTAKKVAAATSGRRQPRAAELAFSNEEDSSSFGEDVDYDQLDLTPMATPTPKQRLPPSSINLATPTSASFVPDATPALSTGTTPSENETPDTQNQHTRQPMSQTAETFYASMEGRTVFTVDDDDDDDGVFLLDTPSKAPKTETVPITAVSSLPTTAHSVAASSVTAAGDYGWASFGRHSSLNESSHPFDTSNNPSWAQDPFASSIGDSFAHSLTNSFYDNDGAV